jgi:peptide/nickel transport system permease protein
MAAYVARRLLWAVVLLFLVSAVAFAIFYVLPTGDPALARAGRQPTPQLVEAIREDLGLNRSLVAQYGEYMGDLVLHLDFGHSYTSNSDVLDQILDRLPATLQLTFGAAVLWLLAGIPLGILGAVRRGSLADRASTVAALVAVSAPVYWLGLVALYLFAEDVGVWGVLPGVGGYGEAEGTVGRLESLILPWLVLAASFAAIYARFVRGSLLDVLDEDYVRTARAKGLRERRVVLGHGLHSAATPVVTLLGLDIGLLLGGAVLVETVFNIPGVGRLAYDAIRGGDLPMIQGTVLFAAFFIVIANLVVDLVYSWLDPRVRHA